MLPVLGRKLSDSHLEKAIESFILGDVCPVPPQFSEIKSVKKETLAPLSDLHKFFWILL